jgi:hypothetical protein
MVIFKIIGGKVSYKYPIVLLVFLLFINPLKSADLGNTNGVLWEHVELSLSNGSYSGNAFDLVATATFTHQGTNETRTTEMFFDENDTWKFRFTGTRIGQWNFTTSSGDQELDGHTGTVTITQNPDPEVRGFITIQGSKFGRMHAATDSLEGHVMNVFMNMIDFGNPDQCGWTDVSPTFSDSATFEAYLDEVAAHGCNAAFGLICNQWFKIHIARSSDHSSQDPDPETFRVLENSIVKANKRGMQLHLWAWGDQARQWTPVNVGGVNGTPDRRLQRYIAARLGPLPGWTMGYGFDLMEWTSRAEIQSWISYLHDHMGWAHLLWARKEGSFDPQLNINATDHRISSSFYTNAIGDLNDGNRPVIYERRFAYLRDNVWTMDNTRKAFWQFTMAGGAGSIWGFYPTGCSAYNGYPYPNPEQMNTHLLFWKHRFRLDMDTANGLTDGYCLKSADNTCFAFYKENTSSIQYNVSALAGTANVIAVDAKKAYVEIDLGQKAAGNYTYNTPGSSDWAIYVTSRSSVKNQKKKMGIRYEPWHIYPNPFNGSITVEFHDTGPIPDVRIYNICGKLVGRFKNISGQKTFWKDTGLPEGIYVLKCRLAHGCSYKKVVLQK